VAILAVKNLNCDLRIRPLAANLYSDSFLQILHLIGFIKEELLFEGQNGIAHFPAAFAVPILLFIIKVIGVHELLYRISKEIMRLENGFEA
jgi:hypothetical protein